MEDVFTHPGEFDGIRSPEVSYERNIYSSMESLLISGVQKFPEKDTFTHPWRFYWYQESRIFIWKIRLLIHGEFAGIRSPGVSNGRCVTHPWRVTVYFYLGLVSFYPLGRCGYLSLVFTHIEV